MADNRPNILYILTDQQYAGAMSCTGNDDLHTPAMDRLAASGVRFDNACCTYPLCTPSRASMLTGMMPHQVGVYDNVEALPDTWPERTLGHRLSDAGYACAYGGKWHLPEESIPEGHGFTSICGFSDWDLADACIDYLRQRRRQPFFLMASFDNPHNICEWSRQTTLPWGPVEDVPTPQCPNLPANFLTAPYESEAVAAERCPRPRSIFRGGSLTEDDWRHYRHAYYRLIEKVDAEIGRILEALDANGLTEDTVVIFTSDHGDGMGAHRWNQKSVLYEESVRVPFIVSCPGRISPPRVDDRLVSGLDLYPTICDYAEVEPPPEIRGLSLRPPAEGKNGVEWRDHVVTETFFGPLIGGLGTHGRMVRTAEYKYVLYSWGKYREQLFHLPTDPGEMTNLAVEARHASVLEDHRQLLVRWLTDTDDLYEPHSIHPEVIPPVPGQEYER
jgi:arylsulfatase A-like enzyme